MLTDKERNLKQQINNMSSIQAGRHVTGGGVESVSELLAGEQRPEMGQLPHGKDEGCSWGQRLGDETRVFHVPRRGVGRGQQGPLTEGGKLQHQQRLCKQTF